MYSLRPRSFAIFLKSNYCTQLGDKTKPPTPKCGLIVGVYYNDTPKLTKFAQQFDDTHAKGNLLKQIQIAGPIKCGETRTLWNVGTCSAVSVVGLGDPKTDWHETDEINGVRENVRIATAAGAKSLLAEGITDIRVEDMANGQSAAEGAVLGTYKFQEHKSCDKRTPTASIQLANGAEQQSEWETGMVLATAQNWARHLMEMPANWMTPRIFADTVLEQFNGAENVKILVHDKAWIEEQKMGSYLSVAKGSVEPPVFLEIRYKGADDTVPPVCLVGKGITFDSGGISIKPSANMDKMRADMGGAACVAATMHAIARLKLPVNVVGLMPLTENMPSGSANKPGDVVYAMNGKSICVDNTDCEGRLVLCDALCYAATLKPKYIVDVATLTGAIRVSLGDCVAGVFTNDNKLWELAHKAGRESGDRVWRLPLFSHYAKIISTDFTGYDINNLGNRSGESGSCKAAAFLRAFVPKNVPWIHFDTYGILGDCTDQPYIGDKGMTGRPVRTVYQLICDEAGQ